MEYPDTSLEGIAIIYNITGWKNPNDVFSDVSIYLFKLYFNKKVWILINLLIYIYFHFIKIQYSINSSGDIIQIKNYPFFSDISVKKDQRTC